MDTQAAAEKVRKYWTAERMRSARLVTPRADRSASVTASSAPRAGKAGSYAPAAGVNKAAIKAGALKLAGGDKAKALMLTETATVGKVFFSKPSGGNWMCSAAALNSASKQLVITAGHCVHEGAGGGWMQNWTFVPRYRNGARPFGTYAAKQFRTFNAWMNSSDFRRDVGMVTTWPLNGQKLVNAVGGNGFQWNWPRNVAVTVLGYPSNHNSGEIQMWCQGTTRGIADGRIEINCNFGGGSSGGPWLREFNDATGLGYSNGVQSTITNTGWNRSPYFDDAVKTMFDAQGGVT
ncbi:peptidase [Actinomadura fulvescens]|uniref:Peptidase n=2 Tax=Actinomadura fulvescens TaxID=46160 RepID=A0ABN3QKZ0_9ACTN